jgi:signal transduction histidine kinase/DNA-binding response OmpR family regulator
MEQTNEKAGKLKINPHAAIIAAVALVLLIAAAFFISNRMTELLYEESVSQLQEISNQLFEKLDVQIAIQWDYLEKFKAVLRERGEVTKDELTDVILHYEEDLGPVGTKIYLRALDEDGHYYTDEGKQGYWNSLDRISGVERQSILLTNWFDTDTFMAFILKMPEGVSVDGKEITYLILLRTMEDMQPFFHSSAFANRNVAYIIDYDGYVLNADGQLDGIDFKGTNISHSMAELTFPHMGSFDAILEAGYPSGTVTTDVMINGKQFYIVYDRLPDYDWAALLFMDSADVAVSARSMVTNLLVIFGILAVGIVVVMIVVSNFIMRADRDKQVIEVQRKQQARLEQLNKQLTAERERADAATEEAIAATKAKSQFLSSMSHDIRTPMNAILGIANLIEHDVDQPEKQRYYIKKLQKSGTYMLGLINDILDMSKIESGDVHINLEPVKLAEQVGQIESIIRSQSNEKRQELTVRVHELRHEYLIGDSIRLRQIYLNLLTNAVKYTPAGGEISFEIAELPSDDPTKAMIKTSVIDNGYGMKPEFLKKIFVPFTREQSTTINKIQGTGLGMAITKSLVDLMGGTITVESEYGKGSRFDVTIPLTIDESAEHSAGIDSVLLVSADEDLTANVRAALSDTSVSLSTAATTDEAIEILQSGNTPDAVLLAGFIDTGTLTSTVRKMREAAKDTAGVMFFCCDYVNQNDAYDVLVSSGVDSLIARPFFFENLKLAVEHSRRKEHAKVKSTVVSPLKGKRFLCAEDNDLNAEILEALMTLHGATCVICPDGAVLVKKFASVQPGDYDAILMDVQMPNMNGMEATRVIRKSENPLGKTIPIIAMTANAFSSDVQDCLNAGMDAHLSKPLDITALERLVEELCDGIVPEEKEESGE